MLLTRARGILKPTLDMYLFRAVSASFTRLWLSVIATFVVASVSAQSVVMVTIETNAPLGRPIPSDFVGLSFGMRALLEKNDGGHFFTPTNQALVMLFQNIGIHHLRVGGTSVEAPPTTPIPDEGDIDHFFGFVRAAGVERVIYSLRLLETNVALNYEATNVGIAKYVWANDRDRLDCFAIGNEPDLQRVFHQDYAITNFATYLAKWRRFAGAIKSAIPDAMFAGPDGSGNLGFTTNFAQAECGTGLLKMVTDHFYVGGKGRDVEPSVGIDKILSAEWTGRNEKRFETAAMPALKAGCAYRLTEANDHYSGGVRDASDTFAGALWALDFLHWWAEHHVLGVDFHNTQWVPNDVITPDNYTGQLRPNPKGYGLKAFELGSHGSPERISIGNGSRVNLTVYSVREGDRHFVTVINKEHGAHAREVKVLINGIHASDAEVMFLKSDSGVAAKNGITLGGKTISNNVAWNGKWSRAKINNQDQCLIKVPAGSAAILNIYGR